MNVPRFSTLPVNTTEKLKLPGTGQCTLRYVTKYSSCDISPQRPLLRQGVFESLQTTTAPLHLGMLISMHDTCMLSKVAQTLFFKAAQELENNYITTVYAVVA